MNISTSKWTGETSSNRYENRYELPDFNDMWMLISIFYHLEFFNTLGGFLRLLLLISTSSRRSS
jgi:hypothetical protein